MNRIYHNLCSTTLILMSLLAAPTTIANTESLTWHLDMPSVPAPFGESIQHGLAGAYSGVIKNEDSKGNSSEQFHWNKQALLFNSVINTWQSLGETPFLPNCGAAIQRLNSDIILINGEIMPGVRTSTIKRATFKSYKD